LDEKCQVGDLIRGDEDENDEKDEKDERRMRMMRMRMDNLYVFVETCFQRLGNADASFT